MFPSEDHIVTILVFLQAGEGYILISKVLVAVVEELQLT